MSKYRIEDEYIGNPSQPQRNPEFDGEVELPMAWDASDEPDAYSPLEMIQPGAEDVSAQDNAELGGWIDARMLGERKGPSQKQLTEMIKGPQTQEEPFIYGNSHGIGPYDDQEPMLPQRGRSPDQTKMSQAEDDGIDISEARYAQDLANRRRRDGSGIAPMEMATVDASGIAPLDNTGMGFTLDESDAGSRQSFDGIEGYADQLIADARARYGRR